MRVLMGMCMLGCGGWGWEGAAGGVGGVIWVRRSGFGDEDGRWG